MSSTQTLSVTERKRNFNAGPGAARTATKPSRPTRYRLDKYGLSALAHLTRLLRSTASKRRAGQAVV